MPTYGTYCSVRVILTSTRSNVVATVSAERRWIWMADFSFLALLTIPYGSIHVDIY